MSKQYRIKWTDNDTKELNRVVRNFNAKINRLAKQNPREKNLLPEKVSVRDLKELINTRKDLNRELNSLKRFSKRGSEEIVTIDNTDYNIRLTKWQRSEMRRRVGIINRRRKSRRELIENLEAKSGGQSLGYKVGNVGMGKQSDIALSPMKAFTPGMTQSWLKDKWKAILNESQLDYYDRMDELLRENIISAIKRSYNNYYIEDIIESIENMSPEKLLKIFEEEGGNFEFFYPTALEDTPQYLDHIRATYID